MLADEYHLNDLPLFNNKLFISLRFHLPALNKHKHVSGNFTCKPDESYKEINMTFSNVLLGITIFCTSLMAGLFYSYSCSVMLGLRLLTDLQFIESMQAINKAIQNPVFFVVFFGVLISLPANAYFQYSQPATIQFWLFLIAGILYVCGVFCVTVFGNIPMNNSLNGFNVSGASAEAIHLCRVNFEGPWNRLNTIRTISSIFSLLFMIIGCISKGGNILLKK